MEDVREVLPKPKAILSGVIPAVLTPFERSDGTISVSRLRDMLEWLIQRGVHAIFVGGTTGEGLLLTTAERKFLTTEVVRIVGRRVPAVIHVGAITTREATELAAHAEQAGADAIAAVPPFYYGYSDRELIVYYAEIARAAPGLPLYLYNIPPYARNPLTPDFVQFLSETNPAVVGMKESSGNLATLQGFLKKGFKGFDIICGIDDLLTLALRHGATGMVCSGAGVFPELYVELWKRCQEDRWEEAENAQQRITQMQEVLSPGGGIPRYRECWRIRGYDLGPPRPPLLEVTQEESGQIQKALAQLGLTL
jgi:dihydrodipicolinate synthase/N-acetylneuraminate lyase